MLTSPTATNKGESWPTLGRPKESIRIAATIAEFSDDESVDLANEDEETANAPTEPIDIGSSISKALNMVAHSRNPRKQQQIETSNGRLIGGKKKKNTKKTILFSTGNHTFDGK